MEKELDFSVEKIQNLTLPQLERTYRETFCDGTPVGVFHHADLINQILDIFGKVSKEVEVINITAINNRDKNRPGVSILKELSEKFGEGSAESHLLRRLVCNIRLSEINSAGEDYHLAISWYQGGCSIGIGPHVYACNNGCILNSEHVFSTRTWWALDKKFKGQKEEQLIPTLTDWATNLNEKIDSDFKKMEVFKSFEFNTEHVVHFIGTLQFYRVAMDTTIQGREGLFNAPLRQTQINYGCEKFAKATLQEPSKMAFTGFEVLNIFNEAIKPAYIDATEIIPEQIALHEALLMEIENFK